MGVVPPRSQPSWEGSMSTNSPLQHSYSCRVSIPEVMQLNPTCSRVVYAFPDRSLLHRHRFRQVLVHAPTLSSLLHISPITFRVGVDLWN
jgi:hypothetical protein